MKAIDIIEVLPFKQFKTHSAWQRRNMKAIIKAGHYPVKAIYDAGMNCYICGESGRCPGWHTAGELQEAIGKGSVPIAWKEVKP